MNITVSHITKAYDGKTVLRDLCAEFPEGQITYVTGPSGCGKTTFARILLGLTKPDSGSVSGLPAMKSAVFQEDRLLEGLSAEENLRAVLGGGDHMEALKAVGLGETGSKAVRAFSGGMRRRLALARGILYPAPFVVLDEPTNGLDPETRGIVTRWALDGLRGRTAVWITHMPEAIPDGSRILRMEPIE